MSESVYNSNVGFCCPFPPHPTPRKYIKKAGFSFKYISVGGEGAWLTKTNLKSPWKVYIIYMCLSDLCVFYEHKNDFQCAFCCLSQPVSVFFSDARLYSCAASCQRVLGSDATTLTKPPKRSSLGLSPRRTLVSFGIGGMTESFSFLIRFVQQLV